jgi:hypothetical protein
MHCKNSRRPLHNIKSLIGFKLQVYVANGKTPALEVTAIIERDLPLSVMGTNAYHRMAVTTNLSDELRRCISFRRDVSDTTPCHGFVFSASCADEIQSPSLKLARVDLRFHPAEETPSKREISW